MNTWWERETVHRKHGIDGAGNLRRDGVGASTVHGLLGLGVAKLTPGGIQQFFGGSLKGGKKKPYMYVAHK